jgi:hypothetical protein
LDDGHGALTQSVEILASMHRWNEQRFARSEERLARYEERFARSEERLGKAMDAMNRLARIVETHEQPGRS